MQNAAVNRTSVLVGQGAMQTSGADIWEIILGLLGLGKP